MSDPLLDRIYRLDEYKALIRTRGQLVWPLAAAMLGVYYAYILIIAFFPGWFFHPVGDGHMTVGMVTGLGVIVFSFIITGIYTHIANTKIEELTRKLHERIENSS